MSNNPSPALAALLSFLFPGLGQLYAGDPRKAVLWALPMLGFIIAALWLVFGGVGAITGLVSSPEKRLALLIVNVAFFLYHIAAMINAYDMAKQERSSSFGRSGGARADHPGRTDRAGDDHPRRARGLGHPDPQQLQLDLQQRQAPT